MIAHYFVGYLIGAFIAAAFLAVIAVLRTQVWIRRAYKLAERSNIALPGLLAERVARLLRNEFLFGRLLTVLTVPLVYAVTADVLARQAWTRWFPWILAGLPLYLAMVSFAVSLWPRWKASGGHRVTHLGTSSVREAFTPAELTAVIIGAVLAAALGAWGLRHVAAPAIWWLACAAALAATFAAWRYAATSIMDRPSSASDALELGWDDLLRFRMVRSLTAATAWGPALILYLIDCMMSSAFFKQTTVPGVGVVSYELQWLPIAAPIAVGVLLSLVFRQGRQLWRRAWMARDEDG